MGVKAAPIPHHLLGRKRQVDELKQKTTDATPANDLQAREYNDSLSKQLCERLPEIVAYIDKDLYCRFINTHVKKLYHEVKSKNG